MTTKRQMRASKNRIPSNVTADYMGELEARDFLTQDGVSPYHDELNEEERVLLGEFLKCDRDFEKWKKFRGRRKCDLPSLQD